LVRPQRHLAGDTTVTLLPYGGSERVCPGKALGDWGWKRAAVDVEATLNISSH
jgi:hypothetical protein